MKNTNPKIIAVDFDGCIVKNAWPDVGEPNLDVVRKINNEKKRGAYIILWTCRSGDKLDEAVKECERLGIILDGVNENAKHMIGKFGCESRKIFADEYWDDRAIHIC